MLNLCSYCCSKSDWNKGHNGLRFYLFFLYKKYISVNCSGKNSFPRGNLLWKDNDSFKMPAIFSYSWLASELGVCKVLKYLVGVWFIQFLSKSQGSQTGFGEEHGQNSHKLFKHKHVWLSDYALHQKWWCFVSAGQGTFLNHKENGKIIFTFP